MLTMQLPTTTLLFVVSLVLTPPVSAKLVNLYDHEVEGDAPLTRTRRTLNGDPVRRWDQAIVPYVIYDNVLGPRMTEIHRAMYTYERFTCLRFVPMIFHADNTSTYDDYNPPLTQGYVRFIQSTGCYSFGCGKMHGVQGQRISCCACLHEIGHALGFMHETRSMDPAMNWMIRVPGPKFGAAYGKYQGPEDPSDRLSLAGYMRKNYMHAGQGRIDDDKVIAIVDLYPESRWFSKGIYYQMMEIDLAHDCAALRCSDLDITCENDGYLTEIDYTCQCQCVAGLDPATGCTSVITSATPTQDIPSGSYALPRPKDGCSDDTKQKGSIGSEDMKYKKRTPNSSNSLSFDLSSTFGSQNISQEFCVKEESDDIANENDSIWPGGAYCIFRKGGTCPDRFETGYVLYTGFKRTEASGNLPDYDEEVEDTKLYYCCRNDTSYGGTHMNLPNRNSFALIKFNRGNCENVRGMHAYEQTYELRHAKTTNANFARTSGFKMMETTVCYYKPAIIDCGEYFELSTDKRTITFSSPDGKDLQCSWFIKAPKGQRLILKFDSFDVPCIDRNRLDIRYFRPGQEGINFCTNSKTNYDMDRTIQSTNNTISIQLNTYGDSTAAFTATVTLMLNEELCYNTEDHGVSYAGKVDFTRFFEPCLPWAEVTHCRYNTFKPHEGSESINAILEGNYCRNPDFATGIMPWCYTDANNCKRNYCDPCQLGTVHDTAADCEATVSDGVCGTGVDTLATGCAKSCGFEVPVFDLPQASTVACAPPPNVADGHLVDNNDLETYTVGSKVTYQCSSAAGKQRARTCLTSGEWSPMATSCDVCDQGWTFDAASDSCFKYFHDLVSKADAKTACQTDGGYLPTPKNADETKVVWEAMWTNRRPHSVWLPLEDSVEEGVWVWDGGEAAEWVTVTPPWDSGEEDDDIMSDEPKPDPINLNVKGKRKDCAVVTNTGVWNHVSCKELNSYVCVMPRAELATCVDFFEGCEAALISKPNMCTDEPEFALRMCPDTCKLCVDRTERELIKLLTNLLKE